MRWFHIWSISHHSRSTNLGPSRDYHCHRVRSTYLDIWWRRQAVPCRVIFVTRLMRSHAANYCVERKRLIRFLRTCIGVALVAYRCTRRPLAYDFDLGRPDVERHTWSPATHVIETKECVVDMYNIWRDCVNGFIYLLTASSNEWVMDKGFRFTAKPTNFEQVLFYKCVILMMRIVNNNLSLSLSLSLYIYIYIYIGLYIYD